MARTAQSSAGARRPGRPAGGRSGEGREALLVAAREVLAEKGLPRLTSREVGERAGLKPTLINYYFGDRDGLLRAVFEAQSDQSSRDLVAAAKSDAEVEQRLRSLVEAILDSFAHEPYAPRLFLEQVLFADTDAVLDEFVERSGKASFDAIKVVLEDGMRQGRFQQVDSDVALAAIGGMCLFFGAAGPLLQRLTGMDPLTPDTAGSIAERASSLLLEGLALPVRAGEGRG